MHKCSKFPLFLLEGFIVIPSPRNTHYQKNIPFKRIHCYPFHKNRVEFLSEGIQESSTKDLAFFNMGSELMSNDPF